jgi:hypothetical protein
MKKLLHSTLATLLFAFLAVTSLHAADKAWLDGRVIDSGYTSADDGSRLRTVTIELLDPENSNPLARMETLIITTGRAFRNKSEVNLSVGAKFMAYHVGDGLLMLRYEDKKGRTQAEPHQITGEL